MGGGEGAAVKLKKTKNMHQYAPETNLAEYPTLLMGDLSGIQEYIFNIKSEGAAKGLKGRSFYVQALSDLCLELIEAELGTDNCSLFYNGGGNFYVFCKTLEAPQLNNIRKQVEAELTDSEIYLNLSSGPNTLGQFASSWENLHREANRDKLRKFAQFPDAFSVSVRKENPEDWKGFVKNLTKAAWYAIQPQPALPGIHRNGFGAFKQSLALQKKQGDQINPEHNFENSIKNKLPVWSAELLKTHEDYVGKLNERNLASDDSQDTVDEGDILEFSTLGYFAGLRTGTDKIAVLKMDVDNLGDLFRKINDPAITKKVSDTLKRFFDFELFNIWTSSFPFIPWGSTSGTTDEASFKDNIYVVFAGGDDCLVIGGWDAVFAFAHRVRTTFDAYLKKHNPGIPNTPTLSASITVLDSKFPVVRMGILAEEALHAAKHTYDEKNCISVFGKVLTWREFEHAQKLASELDVLIKHFDEPRGILHRVQLSHVGFDRLQQRALQKREVHNPSIWKLFYFIRNSRNLQRMEKIIEQYERALLDALLANKQTNAAALFPVAARWAELLTR